MTWKKSLYQEKIGRFDEEAAGRSETLTSEALCFVWFGQERLRSYVSSQQFTLTSPQATPSLTVPDLLRALREHYGNHDADQGISFAALRSIVRLSQVSNTKKGSFAHTNMPVDDGGTNDRQDVHGSASGDT